jgi:serine/threonine-protein kinase
MEFVQGESLDRLLNRRGRMSWEEVVDLGMQLCAALQHAHERGVIHRDLKPSNLMILEDGTIKLTDFGIAKDSDATALTAANSTVGTAAYMAPEQCRGLAITPKTDLYSMGIMFYELLTGRKPFNGETPMEMFQQHAHNTEFKRPAEIVLEVPIWLNTLVDQLMEKEPAKRPLSAKAVADSLQMIKDKVEAQKSAGIEAATKRKIDRARGDKKLDAEDKEAARAMLGKKKKPKVTPIYARGWFTILALVLFAGVLAIGGYFIFRPPSAESLLAKVEALARGGSEDDRKDADDFLRYYPTHEKAAHVRQLADKYDFETLEKQMLNRRNSPLKFQRSDEESAFNKALDNEKDGMMPEAVKLWEGLSAKKALADAEMHAWGLVGEHYLKDHKAADKIYKQLDAKVKSDKDAKSLDGKEQIGLDAVRFEEAKQYSDAKGKWDGLAKKDDIPRSWQLLALKQAREMNGKKNESDDKK